MTKNGTNSYFSNEILDVTILIALIIIGFIVNLFDKKQPKLYTFAFTDYPLMKPIRIATR